MSVFNQTLIGARGLILANFIRWYHGCYSHQTSCIDTVAVTLSPSIICWYCSCFFSIWARGIEDAPPPGSVQAAHVDQAAPERRQRGHHDAADRRPVSRGGVGQAPPDDEGIPDGALAWGPCTAGADRRRVKRKRALKCVLLYCLCINVLRRSTKVHGPACVCPGPSMCVRQSDSAQHSARNLSAHTIIICVLSRRSSPLTCPSCPPDHLQVRAPGNRALRALI
jgi:hypothetical protein